MNDRRVSAVLRAVHDELHREGAVDRERLAALFEALEREVRGPETDESSLLDRLRSHVERFEVEHPTATAITNRVMQALADMGV